ncbi:MAG TPA: DUF2169 domain-containing protein [Gammaproteobacteria bacterium]|nr:DUF2169 domain-containing protein [Gammaproteobacteria bacterium]
MPHPDIEIDGNADFQAVPMFDEDGRSIVVAVTKATFCFDADGALYAVDPEPVRLSPEFYADPAESSLKFDSDTAFAKRGTDVVVLGHARSFAGPVQTLEAGVRVGPVQKVARIIGDRAWLHDGRTPVLTPARPFEQMPLTYERAFGGRDHGGHDPDRPLVEPRNPVGTGFGKPLRAGETCPAPNIVDPRMPNPEYGVPCAPVGFGFIAPHWMPRAALAGTYDEVWETSRKPLLPADFSRRFFNSASEGLTSAEFLRGDESVTLVNIGSAPRTSFRLPGSEPPTALFHLRGGREVPTSGVLDTLVIDADAQLLTLVWRASVPVRDGIQDVVAVKATCQLSVPGRG